MPHAGGHRMLCGLASLPLGAMLIAAALVRPALAEFVLPSSHWRNTAQFPDDPFRKAGPAVGEPGWIKFLIFVSDPQTVYFQDSNAHVFHYDFGKTYVLEYMNLSNEQFDQITLFVHGRQAILGTLVLPYWNKYQPVGEQIAEYGIEFVGQDAFPPEQVISLFHLVRSRIAASPHVQAFYFPTYEQRATAEEHRALFEAGGVAVSSVGRWADGNVAYATGWALGPLKQFPADQITDAYQRGDLTPNDILLTSGVPAEMPLVAGIISLTPSTPNSHVAILANTYDIPFVHLALPADVARAEQLVGRTIALRVYGNLNACDARLIDVQDTLTSQQMEEILALKAPEPLNIRPMTPYGAYSAPTDGIWPGDVRYFGGKAANMGLLRRSIPSNSPVSLGLSFDVWNAFLDQRLANGRTLRAEIAMRLQGFTYPPANMAALSAALGDIRENLFRKTSATSFSPALQSAILAALADPQYGFDPNRNIRFRSSSNAEDSEQFSGAGLYDSYSGCLADELDGDNAGPSICDPSESNERGVFRAVRRVFASFYNENAYLARLKYGMNEQEVGMALLVHHSTPDEFEWANGVAVLVKSGSKTDIRLVTQHGAVSVTNPGDGSIPEEIDVNAYSFGTYLTILGYSNLVPHGATVLAWDSEYRTLVDLLMQASAAFASASGKIHYMLDFEYKKVAPDGSLHIKQIRELPMASNVASVTPFLIGEPTVYETYQGEAAGRAFAAHRLKSRWTIRTRSMWLTPENLGESIYDHLTVEYADSDGVLRTRSGRPADWPEAVHAFDTNIPSNPYTTDTWVFGDMANPRRYTLTTHRAGVLVSPAQCPLLTIRDLGIAPGLMIGCEYDRPVPSWPPSGSPTRSDSTTITPPFTVDPGDQLQTRVMTDDPVSVTARFYWPPTPPTAGGYTAPLARWDQTQITGLTKDPIVLRGYFSQTYHPEHHNFGEHFIFEPRLEPGVSPAILDELRNANVQFIHVHRPLSGTPTVTTYGFSPGADLDGSGVVDPVDTDLFTACATGPNPAQGPAWGCRSPDFDQDGDVDQSDFGVFQRCLSGESPPDPQCAE